ncbi:helix-turn-helix transcriptional regulator [Alicyclobacillus tolerans]|uniref:response regulator transcription factor n=1 Tax=Alicyclobacillus tolerans TaxID=90970 RepID=UPI003558BB31|nr:helix-turn-helix transcriptional regulator [Alicyclobacillus tolerans]
MEIEGSCHIHSPDPREVEVLRLLARNSSDLQIAQILGIRHSTVNFHICNIRRKLRVHSREEAREIAIHEGYFDPSNTKGL